MMKNKLKFSLCLIIVSLFSLINLFAEENPFFLRGIRPLGMGGAGIALSDDQNAFFYNPAGVTDRKKKVLTILDLRFGISDDIVKFYDWFDKNQKDLNNFDGIDKDKKEKLLGEISDKITTYTNRIVISMPNMNYISAPIYDNTYFGIGVFDKVDMKFKMNAGLLVPNLELNATVDGAGIVLLAHKFTDKFSAGVNTKFLGRVSIKEDRLSILAIDGWEPVLQPGMGIGADLGMAYKLQDNLKLGLSVSDIGGTVIKYEEVKSTSTNVLKPRRDARTDIIEPRLNVGVAYKPLKKWFNTLFVPDVTLAMDFMDLTDAEGDGTIQDFSEFLVKTHLGTEFAWKFLALRAGLNSGYPTVGFGLSLWSIKVDYAYYTDEMGMFPGDKPESNHTIALSWRFGTTVSRDKKKK
jgi:hypothetical protein